MKQIILFLIFTVLLLSNDDVDFENDFLHSLEEVSEIATKTKLNIDDTPSFVTVLHADKLQKIGVDNVFEALMQVPGVQLKREASGVPVVVFRGVDQKGEVKLMVDGVTINNSYRGSTYYYLDFPIELIERVEVIRGAGSVLYGSNAMSGVINIITKASQDGAQNTLFASGGTYSNLKGGALVSQNLGDFRLSLDTYYQKSDKTINDTDRHLKDYSLGIKLNSKSLSLLARIKSSNVGNAYGILGVPDIYRDKYYNNNLHVYTKLEYQDSISSYNEINMQVGYTHYAQKIESLHPVGAVMTSDYHEDSYFAEAHLLSKSLQNNKLLLGARVEFSEELKNDFTSNGVMITNPVIDSNMKRDILSIYLNDTYMVTPKLDISAGLRYDNYSDFGNSFSPNLGAIYRISDALRVKGLYSHAFRAPSWVEITKAEAGTDLKAEMSDTLEVGVVFKPKYNSTLRANIYSTDVSNLIRQNSSKQYTQNSKAHFLGSELEYLHSFDSYADLNFILSYVDAKCNDNSDLAGIANILASTSLLYHLDSGVNFGSLLKYVSGSKREINDTRNNFSDTVIFDQTISYTYKSFTTSFVIKDLFDKGTSYPLSYNSSGSNFDFEDGGRRVLLKASWEF
jgi:outer membrane cobalamin receptor